MKPAAPVTKTRVVASSAIVICNNTAKQRTATANEKRLIDGIPVTLSLLETVRRASYSYVDMSLKNVKLGYIIWL